jgi:hypothetical protein
VTWSPVITPEEISAEFAYDVSLLRYPPKVSIVSVELVESIRQFRICTSDPYGPIPVHQIDAAGDRQSLIKSITDCAASVCAIAEFRTSIHNAFDCRFLIQRLTTDSQVLVGVAGVMDAGLIVAAGDDPFEAYVALEVKLRPFRDSINEYLWILKSISGLVSVWFGFQLPAAEQLGISWNELILPAKAYLEGNGIRILESKRDVSRVPGAPTLLMRLTMIDTSSNQLSGVLRTELWQIVSPLRSPDLRTWAISWMCPEFTFSTTRNEFLAVISGQMFHQLRLFIDSCRFEEAEQSGDGDVSREAGKTGFSSIHNN